MWFSCQGLKESSFLHYRFRRKRSTTVRIMSQRHLSFERQHFVADALQMCASKAARLLSGSMYLVGKSRKDPSALCNATGTCKNTSLGPYSPPLAGACVACNRRPCRRTHKAGIRGSLLFFAHPCPSVPHFPAWSFAIVARRAVLRSLHCFKAFGLLSKTAPFWEQRFIQNS